MTREIPGITRNYGRIRGYKNGPCRDGNLSMGLTLNRPNRLEGYR